MMDEPVYIFECEGCGNVWRFGEGRFEYRCKVVCGKCLKELKGALRMEKSVSSGGVSITQEKDVDSKKGAEEYTHYNNARESDASGAPPVLAGMSIICGHNHAGLGSWVEIGGQW